jgi:DNA-binding transcriptional regulator YiaG
MIYEGLGFPIHIENAPIKTLLGEPVLDLNLEWLQRAAFGLLLESPFRLTGSQVHFVRHHLELTQSKFAEMLGLANHSVVSQWERRAEAAAVMDKSV